MQSAWKPGQVATALAQYAQMEEALLYGCGVEWQEESAGHRDHYVSDGIRAELVARKADIDLAIDALPNGDGRGICRDLRAVAHYCRREPLAEEKVAQALGCSERHVMRKQEAARRRIVQRLCGRAEA